MTAGIRGYECASDGVPIRVEEAAEHSLDTSRIETRQEGLSRSAYLLVKGSGPAPSQTRNLNDLAGSRSPVQGPEMRFT